MASNDVRNDDWIKTQAWDLWVRRGGQFVAVESLPDLLLHEGVGDAEPAEQFAALMHFRQLPAYEAAPKPLRDQVEAAAAAGAIPN